MHTNGKLGLSVLLAAVVASGSGCTRGVRTASACSVDDQCGYTGRCVESTCVEDSRPVARLVAPAAPVTFDLLTFEGSLSDDPDDGDRITSHAWTFTSVDAPCAPPVVADTTVTARVRFGCPGRYRVSLVVRDGKGVASDPFDLDLDVLDRITPSLVATGADVPLQHACSSGKCTPAGDVSLSASSASTPLGALRYHWSVEPPPDRPLGADRRVTFTPSADVAAPAVSIESDDAAISGDWIFRVEVRDAAGVVGIAFTRVNVLNRPPVVTAVPPESIPHAFDAATSTFTASGTLAHVTVSDPDGDPVSPRTVSWVHRNDGESVFEGEDLGTDVTFRISVPYGAAEDAAHLIGGPDLARSIVVAATDVNGEEGALDVPIVVDNRPPVLAAPAKSTQYVDHSYDAAQARYRASAELGRWSDPDGDPLFQGADTGDADCNALTLLADGTSMLLCSRAFTGTPSLESFAVLHRVHESVRDPWSPSATTSQVNVGVLNHDPVITSTSGSIGGACTPDPTDCCHYSGDRCVTYPSVSETRTFQFTPGVSDPDGDPVEVRFPLGVTPVAYVCIGSCAPATGTFGSVAVCEASPPTLTITFDVSDGLNPLSGSHVESATCR